MLGKFADFQRRAEMYYVYHSIQRYTVSFRMFDIDFRVCLILASNKTLLFKCGVRYSYWKRLLSYRFTKKKRKEVFSSISPL